MKTLLSKISTITFLGLVISACHTTNNNMSGNTVDNRNYQPVAQQRGQAPQQNYYADARNDLYPPNPRPGECYSRVVIPAQYSTTKERVISREAADRIEITPAKYGTTQQRVLVREESRKLQVVPATYRTIEERIMVEPPKEKIVAVPAKYETRTERVLDKPAHTVWKRGTGKGYGSGAVKSPSGDAAQYERFDESQIRATRVEGTGEVMCLVEVPATYKTIKRKVLVSPATSKRITTPGKYKIVKKKVVDRPATTREVIIPAQYKTVTTKEIIQPAQERRIPIPAQYTTVTKKQKVRDESVEWRPVWCEVNMTRNNVTKLQRALKSEGCYRCQIDGIMGPCTIDAARCYAKPRGLPSGDKYITMEVIKSLGLRLQ